MPSNQDLLIEHVLENSLAQGWLETIATVRKPLAKIRNIGKGQRPNVTHHLRTQ